MFLVTYTIVYIKVYFKWKRALESHFSFVTLSDNAKYTSPYDHIDQDFKQGLLLIKYKYDKESVESSTFE